MAPNVAHQQTMPAAAPTVEQDGAAGSALLHLAPGAVVLLAYLVAFAPLTELLGLPRQLGHVLNVLLVLVPVQLGFLLYLGWRKNGTAGLAGIALYRRSLPPRVLISLVLVLFVWAVVVIALLGRIDDLLRERVFFWMPDSLLHGPETGGYAAGILIGTQLISVVAIGLAAPIVEELYFRGYLLPRVSWMGAWAPVWNTVLFNLYHFWSPWRFVTRTLFTLPIVYAVRHTQSISVGIGWHCLGNLLGELLFFVALLRSLGL